MASLNLDIGLKTFDINGDPERAISFPPSDSVFISRLYDGFEKIEDYHQTLQKELTEAEGTPEVLDIGREADNAIKAILNGMFSDYNDNASDIVFGKLSSVGVAGGVPLWAGLIIAVLEECDGYAVKQSTITNPRLKKLLAKYKKKK